MKRITFGKTTGKRVFEGDSEMTVEAFVNQIQDFNGDLTIKVEGGRVSLYQQTYVPKRIVGRKVIG
jgi:hypothetical protein